MQSAKQLKHDSGIVDINYSVDGQWLVTATDTDKLYFWRADGTPLGKPLELKNIQIRDVTINADNWGVIIISKSGHPYFFEAGDRFIPDRIVDYFDLLARDELFKQQASKTQVKDNESLLDYYQNPPTIDHTFWTAMINKLVSCGEHKQCKSSISTNSNLNTSSEQHLEPSS